MKTSGSKERKTHIDGDKMDLGMPVLAGLGGGHIHNFAGPTLDDNVSAVEMP